MLPLEIELDWSQAIKILYTMAISYLLALPIGWDRERSERRFGLRTFPLVALASCGFMLVGSSVLGTTDGQARVMQGIITGIGFVGGGAIIKNSDHVKGTATAASIWITGALGLAVAYGRYEVALVLSLLTFITLRLFAQLKKEIKPDQDGEEKAA